MNDASDYDNCYKRALNLLARREHSQQELFLKLLAKGFEALLATRVAQDLAGQNLLSDHRFAELYTQSRVQRGYGPVRIQQELQQKGVKADLAEQVLAVYRAEWLDQAKQALKKYQRLHPGAELVKQQRFLYQRGFSADHIRVLVEDQAENSV
jgi:regulatory protein